MLTESKTEATTRPAIPVRSPDLRFDAPLPVLWFRDNTFLTFMFNGFNLTFPEGERLFVHAVHEHLHQVQDPGLREQIRGFSGQEGQHARIHERLFDALRAQGFDLDPFLERYDAYTRWVRAHRPPANRLAVTAALEHYTACLAQLLFTTDLLQGVPDPMRKLLIWHATEELEHRAVAFDVLRAVRPGYPLRAAGFVLGSAAVLTWIAIGMRLFIEQSGTPRARVWRDFLEAARITGGSRVLWSLLAYLRPGFHPSQTGGLDEALRRLEAEGLATPA